MSDEKSRGSSIETLVERYLAATAKGPHGGNYRSSATSALDRWLEWLADEGVDELDAVDVDVMRRYAQELRRRVRSGDIAASSARTYYSIVRACLTWGVEDGRLAANPATAARATTELPDDHSDPERQFWEPADVRTLLADLTRRIDDALDDGDRSRAAKPMRDRAIVSLLATTGVRGAELFRNSEDEREGRRGLRWKRVDLDDGTVQVLGKSQDWEHAQLPPQSRGHLRRHRTLQRPPTDEWPVFPTAHAPSKYDAVRDQVAGDAEALLDETDDVDELLRERAIVPPAITVAGARSLLQRLCERADLAVDGEYLKPHGGRRGVGDVLYRESAELAQSALRHASVRTTHSAYAHIGASETADAVGDVLDDEWPSDEHGE